MNNPNNFENVSYTAPEAATPSKGKAILSLIMGILSIYLGAIPGIIMAVIGKNSAVSYLNDAPNGPAAGIAKVGKILCSIGLPVSIVSTIIVVLLYAFLFVYYVLLFALMGSI